MSYEGYTQHLCAKGHLWAYDCYVEPESARCDQCGGPSVWRHSVDQTNGVVEDDNGVPYPETVPYPLEVDHYEEHVIKVPIYKVPAVGKSEQRK